MSLTFDDNEHRYFWHQKPVPNVTRILAPLTDLSMVDPVALEAARQEGVDMHRMLELEVRNDLDEGALPQWLQPRLVALRSFVEETGFTMIASERRMYHSVYGFAGTTDLIGTLRVPVGRKVQTPLACIDLKRSFLAGRVIGLQLAGYSMLWEAETGERVQRRFALRLLPNGRYEIRPFAEQRDSAVFLAALAVHRWTLQ